MSKEPNTWKTWIETCVRDRDYRAINVSFSFHSNSEIRSLNKELLGHDYVTDIITLDNSTGRRLKVDLLIGVECVESNAKDLNLTLEAELARVMIHGLLHCMGWDDKTKEMRVEMRLEEEKCLISRPF